MSHPETEQNTPAQKFIKAAGCHKTLAKLLGVHETRAYRWSLPKELHGTNGRIPQAHHAKLLQLSKDNNWGLTAEDLILNS